MTAIETLADNIIADLEAGNLPPWRKPWRADESFPRNALTGKAYRGSNIWSLLFTAMSKGYTDPRWMTYGQAGELGGNVIKGEKASPIFFFQRGMTPNEVEEARLNNKKPHGSFWKVHWVFNVAQTEGCKLADLPTPPPAPDPIAAAEAIVAGMPNPPRIAYTGTQAYYSPLLDYIEIPPMSAFDVAEEFYAVLHHEIAHSTGSEKRLARAGVVEGQHFGSDGYGREELVAEMGAAFLNAECGIAPAVIVNTKAYLAAWIKTIRENPQVILTAAAQGQKAADYVLGRSTTA